MVLHGGFVCGVLATVGAEESPEGLGQHLIDGREAGKGDAAWSQLQALNLGLGSVGPSGRAQRLGSGLQVELPW